MARIRTVKPEFWTSEQVVECSPIARLMFIGMWNFCDDSGNHPASYKTLKMEVFPGDEISLIQIEQYANELLKNNLIVKYEGSNGREYWHVTGWHHQKIDRPNPKHPEYEHKKIVDHSTNNIRVIAEPSTQEWKGMEGKVKGILKENIKEKPDSIRINLSEVTDQTFNDFLKLRNAKKSPLTLRAIENIRSESLKAGISLETALIECCARGWVGFKADWYMKTQIQTARASPPDRDEFNKRQTEIAKQKLFGISSKNEKDITHEARAL